MEEVARNPTPSNGGCVDEVKEGNDESSSSNTYTIADLKDIPCLWYKIHVFAYDLRNFREREDSQKRLDSITDTSYIGMPYFTGDEVAMLKSVVTQGSQTLQSLIEETLEERLERRISKRVESGDFRVCAAHDLAPVFEKIFDIRMKELQMDSVFTSLVESYGLQLGDRSWDGVVVSRPKFGPQSKGKARGKVKRR